MQMRSFAIAAALLSLGAGARAQTKEEAVATLQTFAQAIRAQDYEKAAALMQVPYPAGQRAQEMKRLLFAQEISEPGIEALARDGSWGTADEVLPAAEASRLARHARVPKDKCYALALKSAWGALYWTGEAFKILRVESIGRLAPQRAS